jgi:hypothetical protein
MASAQSTLVRRDVDATTHAHQLAFWDQSGEGFVHSRARTQMQKFLGNFYAAAGLILMWYCNIVFINYLIFINLSLFIDNLLLFCGFLFRLLFAQ